jgi:RNA polymerase sigma-70 factor (ECF subfamily)
VQAAWVVLVRIKNFWRIQVSGATCQGNSGVIMRNAYSPQLAPAGTTDAELVGRAGARDEAAIRSIMQSNNRRLYRIARGILRNDSEAENVVQETYVRAFTNLGSFRGDSSLSTWLARIAMNEALGRLLDPPPSMPHLNCFDV